MTNLLNHRGRHSTEVVFPLTIQPSRVRFLAFPNLFVVAEIFQWRYCLERERVDNVKSLIADQTHLVLVSGKLVLKKTFSTSANMNDDLDYLAQDLKQSWNGPQNCDSPSSFQPSNLSL